MSEAQRSQLNRNRMLRYLDRIESAPAAMKTLYLAPGSSVPRIRQVLARAMVEDDVVGTIESAAGSVAGMVLFWGADHKVLVIPPFPVEAERVSEGCDAAPLRDLLKRRLLLGIVLVRLGAYAVGVFDGDRLVSSKVGTGLVHGRHKKGGSSAHRFERHRDKQIEEFLGRVCVRAREKIEPYARELHYLLYGGERSTVLALQKRCDFLDRLGDKVLDRLLNVREPGQRELESAVNEVWTSTVLRWGAE